MEEVGILADNHKGVPDILTASVIKRHMGTGGSGYQLTPACVPIDSLTGLMGRDAEKPSILSCLPQCFPIFSLPVESQGGITHEARGVVRTGPTCTGEPPRPGTALPRTRQAEVFDMLWRIPVTGFPAGHDGCYQVHGVTRLHRLIEPAGMTPIIGIFLLHTT
ncbi:hypothetical protein Bbelb_106060 [Branchiostoma belcheri]|nr:hypothetical protein Bbelb_106060 [Branchiostoma belcheri]